MALPASGAISLSQVNVELGLSATAQIGMNDAAVRTLFGVPSGAISMSDGYGKANEYPFTISSNQTNANLRTLAVNAGWNESSKVVATINSGVYCSANGTGTPGLTVNGSFPNGVELINNGFIIGMGGSGGQGRFQSPANGLPGAGGGQALNVSVALTLSNNGTIGGGGGGGGGGGVGYFIAGKAGTQTECGSGGGGGRTGTTNSAAGGRQRTDRNGVNGNPGTLSAAGAQASAGVGGFGGAGGDWGSSGSTGGTGNGVVAEGGPPGSPGGSGGAGGAAIVGNSNITYLATGTRLGAIT
jgi:hypothetical protein